MNSNKKSARIAGLIYLVVVLTGIFSLGYVPSKLIVSGDAAKTFQNIAASESLFRLSIVAGMICYVAFLLLPLGLYRLLNQFGESYAKLMVLLAVVSVPISFINLQNKFAVLTLLGKEKYLNVFDQNQLQSQVMICLDNYGNGILIATVFWGLWLFPFGCLVYKSGILPRIFGILLILGCFGYVFNFIGETAIPNYGELVISRYITLPATLGEIGICLWLLIFGAKDN